MNDRAEIEIDPGNCKDAQRTIRKGEDGGGYRSLGRDSIVPQEPHSIAGLHVIDAGSHLEEGWGVR